MRVSKNQVTLLSAAVAALFAAGAQAQVTLPGTTTIGTITASASAGATTFARELANNSNVGTAGVTVNTILGVGTSINQDRYVKITLTNATFNANVLPAHITGNVFQANCVAAANITPTVSVGGLAGTSSVTYQLTTPAGANIGDCLTFTMPSGVRLTGTDSAVNVLYEVFEFVAQANAGTPVLYSNNRNYASFAPSVRFQNATAVQPTQTATAISGFVNFNTGGASNAITVNQALIGALVLDTVNAPVPVIADGATASAINTVLAATGNTITVTGDFSAAAAASSMAITGGGNAVLGTGTVSFPNVPVTPAFGTRNVTYSVNGTAQVVAGSYTAGLTTTAATGYKALTYSTLTTGSISRDGVQYESPWVTVTPGFISRFFLTQNSGNTVNWTAIVRNASGLVTGGTLSGTIASGRQVLLPIATLLPADTTAVPGPYQVTINIAADASVSQGAYVLTSPNGAVTSVPLYRAANR
jgi:hypothetical protein